MGLLRIDRAALEALPSRERAEALALLEEAERLANFNPLQVYMPAGCQRVHPGLPPGPATCRAECMHVEFHRSFDHIKAFFGGNRAGKTTTAIVDDLIQAAPRELLPDYLLPFKKFECPFYCRVMTPDMERTMKPVIFQKIRDWIPKAMLRGGSFDKSFDVKANSLRLECGCRFDFLSYEMSVDKFGGAALHRCHFDESPPRSIRTECSFRLADYGGDEIYSLTPLKGLDFTYRTIWKRRKALSDGDPHIFAIKIGIHDNPLLSAEAIERALAVASDDADLAARRDGAFLSAEGLVFPGVERIVLPVPPRPDWILQQFEQVVAIDPGVRFAAVTYIGFDDANRSHTWRSVKRENWVAEDYAKEIKRTLADRGLKLDDVEIVIDPAAVARSLATGENVMDELARYDIHASPAQNAVEAGVMQIRRRIRNRWAFIWDSEETADLREELEEYLLDIDRDHDDGEFKVVKANDHCADSWRYGHMARPWLPEPGDFRSDDPRSWWEVVPSPRPRGDAGENSVMGALA